MSYLPKGEMNFSMAIPCLLIEVWSINMLQTARQTAIKLILQLQLKRLLGSTEDEVIGFAFPQIQIPESVSEIKPLFNIQEQSEAEGTEAKDGSEEKKECEGAKRICIWLVG